MSFTYDQVFPVFTRLMGRTIGYSIILGLLCALISTGVTAIMLNEVISFSNFLPHLKYGAWFVGEFFAIFLGVTFISVSVSLRERDLTLQKEEIARQSERIAERESQQARRETILAQREADFAIRQGEDFLTPFRDKLKGPWEIEFRSWYYSDDGSPKEIMPIDHAIFVVDEKSKKLQIKLRVRKGEIWHKGELIVHAISIQPVGGAPPQTIDYYHEAHIEKANGGAVIGPIFVHLVIEYDGDDPCCLRGKWYDLDGMFAKAKHESAQSRGIAADNLLPNSGSILFRKLTH